MERVDVSILGRDYSLACQPSEKAALTEAIALVDERMRGIKSAGKVVGNERIAVMVAIQVAGELLAMRAPDGPLGELALGDLKRKIDAMHSLIDDTIGPAGTAGN
ncbi:MAG: cell division protein ZapA [Burkholderiaceae bacterium]